MAHSGVRAARAAKDSSESIGGLARVLDEATDIDISGSSMDYVLHTLLLLVKEVCSELRASTFRNPTASIALSLLERCSAPENILMDLRSWIRSSGGAEPKLEIAPPKRQPAPMDEPKPTRTSPVPPSSEKRVAESPKKTAGVRLQAPAEPEPEVGTTSKARKSVMWASKMREADTISEKDSSDDEAEEQQHMSSSSALKRLRNSTATGVVSGKGPSSNIADRRRRFTVSISRVDLPLPPEEEVIELLRPVNIFKNLSDADLKRIAGKVKCQRYEKEESLAAFGAPAEALHIVVHGTAGVSVPHKVGHLKKGDVFGDGALRLANATHLTQVTASGGPMTTISITASDFQALNLKTTSYERSGQLKVARIKKGDKRDEGGGEGVCPSSGFPIINGYRLTASDRQMIKDSVKSNKVLGEVLDLSERQYDMVADAVHLISVSRDEIVMRIGHQGTALMIVQEGLLEAKTQISGNMQGEFKLRAGDSFGELGLLYDAPRTATVTASCSCKLWVLVRDEFELVIRASHTHRIAEYSDLLIRIPYLRSVCGENNIDMLAGVVEEISFLEGEDVCVEGEDSGLLFVVYEGECDVLKEGRRSCTLGRGDWVGETQLMTDTPAEVSVKVTSEAAVLLVLDLNGLSTVLNAVAELRRSNETAGPDRQSVHRSSIKDSNPYFDHADKTKATAKVFQARVQKAFQRQGPKSDGDDDASVADIRNLEQVGALGEGTFGLVYLFESRDQKSRYALKAVSKEHITRENLGNMMQNERNIMFLLDSRFIVHLHNAYQDEKYVYLLLEAAMGGELFEIYAEQDMWGKLHNAKYYFASVALGLQALHLKRVIYRDLKLENCLLDDKGHLKLTDMGVAKVVIGKTYTVCGTADYFAPEILRQLGHNRAVDWWASGVLLFIMVAGRSPFDAPEVPMIYKNIIKGFSKVRFPKLFPSDLIDLIKSLCRKQPEERVTMQKGGIENLKEMPFFSRFDWEDLADGKMDPPYVPGPVDYDMIRKRKLSREWSFNREDLQEWDGAVGIPDGVDDAETVVAT